MRVADRSRELLYASERGSASPMVAWLLLGQLALIVGLFGLFWILHRIMERRSRARVR